MNFRDRIKTTSVTFELDGGASITFTSTEKVSNELIKEATYDASGNINGYDWHDIIENQSTIYNKKGEIVGGGASYDIGNKRTHTQTQTMKPTL